MTKDELLLLFDLTDSDPCSYDHHGYCQAHGWFASFSENGNPNDECPHARAKRILADHPVFTQE